MARLGELADSRLLHKILVFACQIDPEELTVVATAWSAQVLPYVHCFGDQENQQPHGALVAFSV